jgi:hypothetical protein
MGTSPGEIKKMTLRQLRETRSAMMELKYLLALEKLPENEKGTGAALLSQVQMTYLKLRSARLRELREGLTAGQEELESGMTQLNEKLGNLEDVRSVIKATTAFLSVVNRILALL